ncbi:Appr-1-p processing [Penicillium brevicompactum]|uniref:Appr-1-p processing n=1 Tax=Penicillium brevicompactum TaxID=5074 RepID=UPI0025414F01|nr:Appr-1-p processing [Penicillium brevicompactum]KAJ5332957.1 Appr-1-p processing [Penicillium brevicompactum]
MAVPWYEDILNIHVHESPGSLFDSPDGSALIRMSTFSVMQWFLSLSTNYTASDACNCMGVWGSGIANDFRQRASGSDTTHSYPAAHEHYIDYCRAYLLAPKSHQISGPAQQDASNLRTVRFPLGTALVIPPQELDIILHGSHHWIVCLFASYGYGRARDPRDSIECSVHAALQDLSRQLNELEINATFNTDWPQLLCSNRFCSGYFRVPWGRIRPLIESSGLHINVCTNDAPAPPPDPRLAW